MARIDDLRQYIDTNPMATGAEIAEELGCSRQRVSQLCSKAGIKLRGRYARRPARPARPPGPPVPRVVTGGVATAITHSVAGAIAEILVCADLMARGYKPYMPIIHQRSHDVIAVNKTGKCLTIEVRSGHRRRDGGGGIVWRKTVDCISDHYAIVLTGEPVVYEPPLPPHDVIELPDKA